MRREQRGASRNKNKEEQSKAEHGRKDENREELEDELKKARELMQVTELWSQVERKEEQQLQSKAEEAERSAARGAEFLHAEQQREREAADERYEQRRQTIFRSRAISAPEPGCTSRCPWHRDLEKRRSHTGNITLINLPALAIIELSVWLYSGTICSGTACAFCAAVGA